MDANHEARLLLRFYQDVEQNTDAVLQKFKTYQKNHSDSCLLKIRHNHIWLDVPASKKEYWSPHLHLELESKAENETHIRGLFGPDPTLWTFFMFLHFMVAGVFLLFSGIAYSDYVLKLPVKMDFVVMALMVIVWFLLYFIAKQIRFKGQEQMNDLEKIYLEIINS